MWNAFRFIWKKKKKTLSSCIFSVEHLIFFFQTSITNQKQIRNSGHAVPKGFNSKRRAIVSGIGSEHKDWIPHKNHIECLCRSRKRWENTVQSWVARKWFSTTSTGNVQIPTSQSRLMRILLAQRKSGNTRTDWTDTLQLYLLSTIHCSHIYIKIRSSVSVLRVKQFHPLAISQFPRSAGQDYKGAQTCC